jgi:CheY-like chemotaxis protein
MPHGGFFSVDALRGIWVLVVDADALRRRTLVDILSYCGALVTPLTSADEALGVMRRVQPDVLIVAVADAGDLGFIGAVRALKPEDGGVVPAIAVVRDLADDLVRSRGFQACVRTPLDPWELCRLVSSLMATRR